MNGKFSAAWDKVRFFCAEQTVNFYIGMALAVLLMLNLRTIIPAVIGIPICPIAATALYLILRAFKQPMREWKGNKDIGRGALASFVGGFYAVILTLL
jgi:hypothetical protein